MTSANLAFVTEGDWVSGTTPNDEKFIGFVQTVDQGGFLEVSVTQCDHEAVIGTRVETKLGKVKKLADSAPQSPEELRGLIEIALMAHDKEWFDELGNQLNGVSASAAGRPEAPFAKRRENPRRFGFTPRNRMDA